MQLLMDYWGQEQNKMILDLVKAKTKSKKQKDLLKKLRDLTDATRNAVLAKYLDKCKHENAVAFFEWRKNIMNKHLDKDQQFALSLRLGRIKRSDTLLFQNTEDLLAKDMKKLREEQVFITENEPTLEDLVQNAPLKFRFVPARKVMQQLIIKGTQVKNLSDFVNL